MADEMMEGSEIRKERCIDVVFCIDGTGSMVDILETVKKHAQDFYESLLIAMNNLGSDITQTRVKVIVFRDYKYDGLESMQISDFFTLNEDIAEYESFLASVRPVGGGDGPENGLEALYYAMQSSFETGDDDRQIIVLFTDADALPLGARKEDSEDYPVDMVDEAGLFRMWRCKDQERRTYLNRYTKRLVIFAPAGTKYEEIANTWDLTWFKAVNPADGLEDVSFEDIIHLISASASAKAGH